LQEFLGKISNLIASCNGVGIFGAFRFIIRNNNQ